MPPDALAFLFEKDNKQSIAALIGAIELEPRLDALAIHLLNPRRKLLQKIKHLAKRHRRLVLGASFTTPRLPKTARRIQEIRAHLRAQRLDNVSLVAGGPHPSGDWPQTLELGFDMVLVGEGEKSFPKLLARLYQGGDLGQVQGLAYRSGGQLHFSGRSPRVQNLDDYPPFAPRFPLFSSIEISRGCPWACQYCQTSFLFGGRMRHRSVENIAHWAAFSARHERPEIRFVTPDAFAYGSDGKRPRLEALAAMLQAVASVVGRKHVYLGSFPSEVRPESVSREAVELVKRFAANDNLLIGAQSGSQRMLDLSHRGGQVADIYRAVEITLAAGLVANVDFIFGMPGEAEADRALTRKMIKELAAMGARIHSHAFMPLAGTPWADAPPGRLDEKTRRLLERLTGKGQHFGQWRQQQAAAQKIADLRPPP